jgi:hypothetical protein
MGEFIHPRFLIAKANGPDRVLGGAALRGLTEAVVIGVDADGEFYFASSLGSEADTLFHLRRAQHFLMKAAD